MSFRTIARYERVNFEPGTNNKTLSAVEKNCFSFAKRFAKKCRLSKHFSSSPALDTTK
jgi:hypothetical protein